MMKTTDYTGKPISRVDGKAKVKGEAKYAAEFEVPGLVYGHIISSEIAKGRIISIDSKQATSLKGVIHVFTHENVPDLPYFDFRYKDFDSPTGKPFRFLQSDRISFNQQPAALVVAETYELARYAASLVTIEYEAEVPDTNLLKNIEKADLQKDKVGQIEQKERGSFGKAFKLSDVQIEAEYYQGAEHHNPLEMHATLVKYGGDGKLTIYDKTQSILNSQLYIKNVFGLSKKVEVISPFVGGAFGSGLRPQYNLFMAVMAALELKRSVKVMLTRQQMFSFGHRPMTHQKIALGAFSNGVLNAISHTAISETSQFEQFAESITNWSGKLYKCPNVQLEHRIVPLDVYTPGHMRAPGAATGMFALECAMDELSYKLGIDPLQLRIINYSDKDESSKKPYSSKELMSCYTEAAEKFGWSKRNPTPRSMKEGNILTGFGMATGMWEALFLPSSARAILTADGKLTVGSGTADIGTGTYTIMTQIAADTIGLPINDVNFMLGDTALPYACVEGGSATAASVGTAVQKACLKIKEKLFKLLKKLDNSPFKNADIQNVTFSNGNVFLDSNPGVSMYIKDILLKTGTKIIKGTSTGLSAILKQSGYSKHTHSAVFAEVKVDESIGTIKVSRVVSAIAAGRILNPKTARSQILGGIVWGISQALFEDSIMDHQFGRFMNHNFADYHIPVNLDINDIEIIFVNENDDKVNPLGVKGVGEIGLVGVAAAIANAVFHATGKRIRTLPITLDKLL